MSSFRSAKKKALSAARRARDREAVESIQTRENKHEVSSAAAERALDAPSWIPNVLWVLASALWAVLGFVLWVPYLTRQLALFLFVVPRVALTGGSAQAAETRLRDSAGFYRRGFDRIRNLRGETIPTYTFTSKRGPENSRAYQRLWGWMRLTGEVMFACVFWGALEYALRDAGAVASAIDALQAGL